MEWHRREVAWRRDRLVQMLDETVRCIRQAPFGTQRRHADRVASDLGNLRVELGNLLYEADDCFGWDEPAQGSHRRI